MTITLSEFQVAYVVLGTIPITMFVAYLVGNIRECKYNGFVALCFIGIMLFIFTQLIYGALLLGAANEHYNESIEQPIYLEAKEEAAKGVEKNMNPYTEYYKHKAWDNGWEEYNRQKLAEKRELILKGK